ncbi:MAG: OmpL47-type beta-barrel domain-containing protein [Ruthenibacterium lactatiformans]|uniref:OmpL47-type beta-barrel domain-containing protein n=2 Tax=Ruthenibacterium lactatiformans TaxID=1550024 RepID=UPI003992726C
MNRIKKVSRPVTCLLALLLCVTLFASTAFAAGGALGADRNGTPYTYVIGYMYSGSSQTVNTREIFTSPNNYDIWLCPVCGRDPLGNSQGTALSPNLYMPCYGYDIAAAGGDMSIRYALVRHRHNNGQLSNDKVYIPVNVPMYAGCYYGYDLTEPAGVQISAPTGWQRDSAVVRFSGGTDTGTSLPDWSAAPGDYGSGIHHYEYSINGGAWTGCPVGDPTVTITAGGETTVTARVVDGAGNASGQTATAKVFIDPASPNVPSITLSTEQWTNTSVTATVKDNGDAHSGVARTEYSLDGGSWTTYSGVLSIAGHGKHTVSARAIDNVGRISGTASKAALVDKVAPVISKVEQQPDSGHTEMTLAVTATDADSGVKGYAVTTEEKAPALDSFTADVPKADHNGVYYIWAADKAGNISAAAKVDVTALDIVPPVVVKVETQRTWDAKENWAKVTAQDDNSGVVAIGWERAEKDMGSRHAPDPITWVDSTAEAAFIFTGNGSYNAYARDLAGNVSGPYPFIIDHIDKHSPVIDSVEWDKGWSQSKTITVKAHDTESGLGQYAVTRTADRPAEWQDSNVFANITENGTYYLWAKDNVQRVSADADADGGEDTPGPGPEEIVIDTIDRSRPVMDDILHSAADNAPAGMFGYPHFNEVDRPELLAHDLADEGWTDSGIKAIYYQYALDEDHLEADWLTYDELDKPAMREEYFGNIYAKAEDNAGNVSDAIFAGFMFEQTEPVAEKTLTPDHWTNGTVEIDLSTDDNLSGVRDITLPDGSVVDATQAKYTVDKNGVYNFSVRDYCGNILSYPVEVSNIDLLAPAADYEVMPGDWTNKPVTIRVTAADPEPEDGYAPSGVKSITMPDGTVVEGSTADFATDANGKYDFIITDNGGNTFTLHTGVSNIDYLAPEAEYSVTPDIWTNGPAAIHVTATDPEPEDGYVPSGVRSITLPDGTVVAGDATDFTVSANGTYDFVITDNGGNTTTLHAQVGNVDTARPTVDFHFEPLDGGDRTIITEYGKTEYYNYDIIMNASAGDVGSGIERYEYKAGDGEWTVFDPADPPKFTEEQIVHIVVRVWDVAGNVSEEKARDIVLDKTPPTASHTLTPGKDGKVNINLGTDGSICGVQSITRPDGSVAYGVDTLVFEVDRNGDYDFFVWDRCGNLLKYTVPVDSFAAPVEPEPAPSEPEEPKPEPEPEPDPEPEGPAAPVEVPVQEDARALTLADLACTLLSILFAILVWLRRKKDGGEDANDEDEQVDEDVEEDEPRGYAVQKTVNAVLAVLSVVLFFLTQPLVWRFRLVDWWTVLFVLLCGTALAMLIWRRRSESATEEDTDEE